uniref:(northern house mosquito) hypothetical protein n=1 Tax=Culex pipiens TaxID=7175 RepID=A0A8D8DJ38_CULPI
MGADAGGVELCTVYHHCDSGCGEGSKLAHGKRTESVLVRGNRRRRGVQQHPHGRGVRRRTQGAGSLPKPADFGRNQRPQEGRLLRHRRRHHVVHHLLLLRASVLVRDQLDPGGSRKRRRGLHAGRADHRAVWRAGRCAESGPVVSSPGSVRLGEGIGGEHLFGD